MPTECTPNLFGFSSVEGREVVCGFDGGAVTSEAGGLLLGATDRAIRLVGRFAGCVMDARRQASVGYRVAALVRQRVFGIAPGYEDLLDHDELRDDPVMRLLSGRLSDPLAGKSTLNRLDHGPEGAPTRHRKIGHDAGAMSAGVYRDIFVPAGAVYFTTVGYGTGALLGRCIRQVEAAHWLDELGIAQAMWVLRVQKFGPLIVESDLEGNSLFEAQNAQINQRIEKLYEGLKEPALKRHGETDDKTKELI